MCGIFAAINSGEDQFTELDYTEAIRCVLHRGPDNIDQFTDEYAFMGHTRVAIIDVKKRANQPFYFENLVLTYNGEVYNYIELREELIQVGYEFDTESDTEVVIKAFHHWGTECFSKFNGAWAMVLYDRETHETVISRDRFGQKPLFMLSNGNTTYFASEPQQLVGFWNQKIDYELVQSFLKEGGYSANGRTFFTGVRVFPKAHFAVIQESGKPSLTRYWDYWTGPIEQTTESTFKEFEELLEDAVRLRLRTDVRHGFLLSGGIDSTVVATLADNYREPATDIDAFTYSSKDADDETKYAEHVASELNINLNTREQETDPKQYRARLQTLVRHLGRGHSSPAIVSVDYLYEAAAESGSTVVLDGVGADELLAGNPHYHSLAIPLYLLKGHPRQAFKIFKRAAQYGLAITFLLYLRNILPPSLKTLGRRIYGYGRFFTNYKEPDTMPEDTSSYKPATNLSVFNRFLINQHDIALENSLYYGDIVAMRHSIEGRSPFMDFRLVDFTFSKDEFLKLWDGLDKYALKKMSAYSRFAGVLNRKKVGFSSDVKPETTAMMIRELRGSPILDWPIFTPKMAAFTQQPEIASPKYSRLLFRLYQVHLWQEIFVHPVQNAIRTVR